MILPTSKNAPLLLLLAAAISIGGCDKKAADEPGPAGASKSNSDKSPKKPEAAAEGEADKTPKKKAEPAAPEPEAEPADQTKDEADDAEEEANDNAQDREAGDTD